VGEVFKAIRFRRNDIHGERVSAIRKNPQGQGSVKALWERGLGLRAGFVRGGGGGGGKGKNTARKLLYHS